MDEPRRSTRYLTIAAEIERTLSLHGAPDRLESERALATKFACQRGTVRRALQLLESRGLIYRRQRSGWYRSPARLDYVLTGAPPLADLAAGMGRDLATEVLTSIAPEAHKAEPGMAFRREAKTKARRLADRCRGHSSPVGSGHAHRKGPISHSRRPLFSPRSGSRSRSSRPRSRWSLLLAGSSTPWDFASGGACSRSPANGSSATT